jgi:hypothetical protein
MDKLRCTVVLGLLLLSGLAVAQQIAPAPNGLRIPDEYKNWKLIGVAQRSDNNTMRAILGNDVAIKAAREGNTKPWPDGAILGKLVWKSVKHDRWETATEAGDFVHAEFMFKDTKKRGCKKVCVNGQQAGNCHIARSDDDRREESRTEGVVGQPAG